MKTYFWTLAHSYMANYNGAGLKYEQNIFLDNLSVAHPQSKTVLSTSSTCDDVHTFKSH